MAILLSAISIWYIALALTSAIYVLQTFIGTTSGI